MPLEVLARVTGPNRARMLGPSDTIYWGSAVTGDSRGQHLHGLDRHLDKTFII